MDDWARLLSSAEFAYNNTAHKSTKNTPFFIEYGRHPRAGPTLDKATKRTDVNDIVWARQEAQNKAKATLELAAERIKWYYDKSVQKVPFQVGDKVMLDLKDYQKSRQKFSAQRYGPFTIAEKLSPVTFRLEWPEDLSELHLVFHASKLSPYKDSKFAGQKYDLSPPVEGFDEYKLEQIVDSAHIYDRKTKKRILHYKIRWKGYPPDADTWEPALSVKKRAAETVEEFHKAHPQAIHTVLEWDIEDFYKQVNRSPDEIWKDPIHQKCKCYMHNTDK
jgi:hypothetical protein